MAKAGIKGMRFSHGFASSMSEALRSAGWKIVLGYTDDLEAVFISDADEYEDMYGLAVDIGTTTVVVYLVDLADGRLRYGRAQRTAPIQFTSQFGPASA